MGTYGPVHCGIVGRLLVAVVGAVVRWSRPLGPGMAGMELGVYVKPGTGAQVIDITFASQPEDVGQMEALST